jgi:predicted esterase
VFLCQSSKPNVHRAKLLVWAQAALGLSVVLFTLGACRERQTPASSAAGDSTAPEASSEHSLSRAAPSGAQTTGETHAKSELVVDRFAPAGAARPDSSTEPAPAAGWPNLDPPAIERDFCTERVHTLDADACFALPERRTNQLLIYLHGIIPPTRDSVQKTNLEKVVANASERAGVVALVPRGKQGFAPKAFPGWWGWPTSKSGFLRHGSEFVAKVREKHQKLEATLGTRFERIFLAGSSSGAYFVVAVALFGAMPEVSGFGVISGGTGFKTPQLGELSAKPVYVGFGKHDSVAGGARALGQQLQKLGWPVQLGAHAVPHGAREIYLDEAFEFWAQH